MWKMVEKFEFLTYKFYKFFCIITRKGSLPTINAEIAMYSIEFIFIFNLLYILKIDFYFWMSLIIIICFNFYFMYFKRIKEKVRKELKI